MFCGKCGTKNADGAAFCVECGAKLNGEQIAKVDTSITVNADDKNRKVGMIAVAVAAVIVIGLIFALFGGRSYKATVDKFVNAQLDADAEALFKLIPKKVLTYALEESGYEDDELDELIDEANEDLQDYVDYIENFLGEDWKVSYDILNVENVTGDDLDDVKDAYEEFDVKVSAAKTVEIELMIKAGETEMSNSVDVSLIKVGRSWYIDIDSMGSIF